MISSTLTLFAAECHKTGTFLGLDPWYKYINDANHFNDCDIVKFTFLGKDSDIPLIALAIVDDLLRIAALVSIGFIIAGAIKLITSQGDPEGRGNAQSTIINALIGLAIAIIAIPFVSYIGHKLGN